MGAECEYLCKYGHVCVQGTGAHKNPVTPWVRAASAAGSDLSSSENSPPKAKAGISQAAAPLEHSWGLETSAPEQVWGKKQQTSFPQEPPQPSFPLKNTSGVVPDPKTSTLIDLFAPTPPCANHARVPSGMGQGLAHPQGNWESSGSISWKRPWIHFEGSGRGVGNVLIQRRSRALPAHTPSSWDISPNPHPGWQNLKDERV